MKFVFLLSLFALGLHAPLKGQPAHAAAYGCKALPVDLKICAPDSSRVAGRSCFTLKDHFVWGGAPMQGEDGRYYMVFSAFECGKHCFSDAWVLGSKLGLAVSDRPDGGFEFVCFFMNADGFRPDRSAWDAQTAHNPHLRKFGGKYYLYYIGADDPLGRVPIRAGKDGLRLRERVQQNLKIGVVEFDSFAQLARGEFRRHAGPLLAPRTRVKPGNVVNPSPQGTRPLPDNLIAVNPSVVYRPQDGKYLLYFKGNVYDPSWRGIHGVAIGDSPTGPFAALDEEVFTVETKEGEKLSAEDPYVWYNEGTRSFHAVFKDFTGRFTKGEPALAQMCSTDGIRWELPEQSLFMKKELRLRSGGTVAARNLERPQLLLDAEGNPLVLFAACSLVDIGARTDGGSFNVQIPLEAAR